MSSEKETLKGVRTSLRMHTSVNSTPAINSSDRFDG